MQDKLKEFIREIKDEYRQTKSVSCPAFGGELVYFNKHGFNHLFRTGKGIRSIKEQYRRMRLFPRVIPILAVSKSFYKYKKIVRTIPFGKSCKESVAHFWTFVQIIDGKKINVLVRQVNNGNKHYFSVANERVPKSAQAPQGGLS